MDRYASSEVLDCMQAYYKVAMKSLIDNVAVQVVETMLVGRLGELLSPARVLQMKSDLISKIAAESSDNRFQREQLSRKLVVLQAGIETCRRYVGRSTSNLQRRAWHAEALVSSGDELDSDGENSASQVTEADIQDLGIEVTPEEESKPCVNFAADVAFAAEPVTAFSFSGWPSPAKEVADSTPFKPKKFPKKKEHRSKEEVKFL